MSEPQSKLSRRRALAGAGAAGALAAAVAVLPKGQPAPEAVAAAQPAAEPAKRDGYQVTPHVLRYYQTTRI